MKELWDNRILPSLIIAAAVVIFILLAVFLITDASTVKAEAAPECPFVENTDAKGCTVPDHLTCNADWSHCELKKDDVQPVPEIPTPPAASDALVSAPAPVKKGCYE